MPSTHKAAARGAPAETAASNGERMLSIGALAKKTGVSPRTIRYYEEIGVFPPPPRSEGGTRRYPPEYVFYIEGAKAAKQWGFSLDEIVELGQWGLAGRKVSKRMQAVLAERLTEIEHRIKVWQRVHDLLSEAMSGRPREGSSGSLLAWLGGDPQATNGERAS